MISSAMTAPRRQLLHFSRRQAMARCIIAGGARGGDDELFSRGYHRLPHIAIVAVRSIATIPA